MLARPLALAVAGALAVMCGPSPARACRCPERPLLASYESAALVFLGRAKLGEAAAPSAGHRAVRFDVIGEPFKGDPGAVETFETGSSTASCGVELVEGRRYLVFASPDPENPRRAYFGTCDGSRPFDPEHGGELVGFPDTPADRVLAHLERLRSQALALERGLGGVPEPGSIRGLLELPSTLNRDREEVKTGAAYATVALHVEPSRASPVVTTIRGEDDVVTRESAYELAAAVVFDEQDGWLELHTPDGRRGWLRPPANAAYLTLEALLPGRLAYLTDAWDGTLWPTPGAGYPHPVAHRDPRETPVSVERSETIGDSLWFYVKRYREDPCKGAEGESFAEAGWVPAWNPDGDLTLWFWSRGC